MVIAEQNVALLEGRVDRILGMHAGQLKGEASAAALAIHDYGRGYAMDFWFVISNAIVLACIYGTLASVFRSPGRA